MFASKVPPLLALMAALASPLHGAEGIEWGNDLPSALATSASTKKPVLLRFTAKWCAPCRIMDLKVWSDPIVAKAVDDRLIPVAIDIDTPGAGGLAVQYRVTAVPAILVLDHEGREVSRTAFMDADRTLEFLGSVPSPE